MEKCPQACQGDGTTGVRSSQNACEFEGLLEDVAAYVFNVGGVQTVATFQIQYGFKYGLTMDERTVFLYHSVRSNLERWIVPVHKN